MAGLSGAWKQPVIHRATSGPRRTSSEKPCAVRAPETPAALGVVAFLALVAGCARGPDHVLSGAVSHGGRPVPRAFIQFQPDAAAGNTGPSGSAEVVNGRYRTRPGFGVVQGPYIVRIMPEVREVSGGDEAPDACEFPDHVVRIDLSGSETTLDFTIPAESIRRE